MNSIENDLAELLDYPAIKACSDEKALESLLIQFIDVLLVKDFPKLCQLLYRVDVDEQGLKQALSDAGGRDPAAIIAAQLLERQKQKLALRQSFAQSADDIEEQDKW